MKAMNSLSLLHFWFAQCKQSSIKNFCSPRDYFYSIISFMKINFKVNFKVKPYNMPYFFCGIFVVEK